MSAKSLIRYRSTVGGEDPLSSSPQPSWSSEKESVKKSSMREVGSVSETSSNNRLEEDSFDEGIDDILAQNPACNLCGHNFHNTQDFLGHVRMHFSGGQSGAKRKPDQSPPYPGSGRTQAEPGPDRARKRKAETESVAVPAGKKSPKEGEVLQGGRRGVTKPGEQLAPDSAALFDLLNTGYSQEYQAAAAASQQFQHTNFGFNLNFPNPGFLAVSPPGLPHMMPGFHPGGYPPPPHLLSPPVQQFKCLVCPATFEKREAFLYHLNFHSSYLDPSEANKQSLNPNISPAIIFPGLHQPGAPDMAGQAGRRQRGSPPARTPPHQGSPSPPGSDCTRSPRCGCNDCHTNRQSKKKKQTEDIDPDTLRKIQALEWEKKHGYWCTKCKKRFPSQAKLVDHMSYSVEHNYKEEKKRKTSGSVGSAQPSPSSSEMSNASPSSSPSPSASASFHSDLMSVLSPSLSHLPI